MNKLITTSLPPSLLLAIIMLATTTSSVMVFFFFSSPPAYGQDDLIGGSPDVPVQIDPEHASPPLIEPSPSPQSPSSSPSSPTPTPQQQQLPQSSSPALVPPPTPPPTNDPELQRFDQIYSDCFIMFQKWGLQAGGNNNNNGNNPPVSIIQIANCTSVLEQGIAKYCENFETYDAAKCAHVSREDVRMFLRGSFGNAPITPTPPPSSSPLLPFLPPTTP
jgi:hypothetical protein